MSKISKTAKSSTVADKFEKKTISDEELIRLLRIDRESGLYPTVQGADALLREYDKELAASASLLKRAEFAEKAAEALSIVQDHQCFPNDQYTP